MLSVTQRLLMLSVIMLNVVMLSVVKPQFDYDLKKLYSKGPDVTKKQV